MLNQGNWKQHPVYTNYWFCDDGRVASTSTGSARIIKPISVGKYLGVAVIQRKDVNKKIYVHRAVCELFNGTSFNGAVCRHLDGNKLNNASSNLAWATQKENLADMHDHGTALIGEKNPMARLTDDAVASMRLIREKDGLPYHVIAKIFGVSAMTAHRAINHRSWK